MAGMLLPGFERRDLAADDFDEPAYAGAGSRTVRIDEVQRCVAFGAFGERQPLERAGIELLADVLLGIPCETEAHAGSPDRRRLVGDRPALFVEPATGPAAARARVADYEVPVL